jgi:endogenous inhibitor of DNA gyrase (YacG/DUF329 family)
VLFDGVVRISCPTCKTVIENVPEDFPSRPFCSARCKLLDLGNWLNETYRISEPAETFDVEPDDDVGALH